MSKEPLKPTSVEPASPAHAGEDELIHAPRGMRKSRVVMGVVLIVMLLTLFWQGDALMSTAGRRSAAQYMSYRPDPGAPVREVSEADFVAEKQAFNKFAAIAYGARMDSDEATASFILMSDVAERAGVRVTDEELKEFIRSRFPTNTKAAYLDAIARYRMSPREFEETLRRFLRIERYQNLLAASLAAPDPAEIERLWKTRHQEYSFDYVELPVETLREDAAKEAPDSAALLAWFEALPEPERKQHEAEAAVGGEIAGFPLKDPARPATVLLEKYPLASGTDLEALARQYYSDYQYVRFRDPDFVFPQSGQVDPSKLFLTWEKAEEAARREAPIHHALESWLADMTARAGRGEPVDVAAEAQVLGVEYAAHTAPKTYAEWSQVRAEQDWIGGSVVSSLFDNGKNGEFLPAVMVDETSMGLGRASEKRDAAMPPFDQIEAKVRDSWVARRAGELAVARLEALRDAFGTRPPPDDTTAPPFRPEADAEAFAAAVRAAGLEVARDDWAERNAVAAEDGPFERFLRQRGDLYTLKEGTVAKAELAGDKDRAYLVRVAGVRDADTSKMTPADVQMLSRQIAAQAMDEFRTKTFRDQEFLEERYALKLASLQAPAGEPAN